MTIAELREQAARAERLAWAVCDSVTAERLIKMSKEFRRHADELDRQDHGHDAHVCIPSRQAPP